ncbi:MAG: hypothetical protein IJF03_02045 [Lachnospiraceae bacterium]|nr:hypothetical protein [Lachnospiraceae bacterium]
MKNKMKSLLVIALMGCCMYTQGMTVRAENVKEVESNDTMEMAQLIEANSETAAQAVSGNRPDQYVVNGYTSTKDVDWYKVYLSTGTQYVTCNEKGFNFQIYAPNGNIIMDKTYTKTGLGSTAYAFSADTSGYYYVKVSGITSSSQKYLLLVGGPTYSVAYCEVKLDEVIMEDKEDSNLSFDLSCEEKLPNNAVVYTIAMEGVRTTAVNSVAVTNSKINKTVNLTLYLWKKSDLVSMKMPLKSEWKIKFGYRKDVSFTPSIKLYYAYPVVSKYAEDDLVITP